MLAAQGAFTEEELKKTALANLGWWHHSLENTIDKLDFEFMADHLRVYAAYLWELCTAVVLPFEYVSVADQFIERLDELKAGRRRHRPCRRRRSRAGLQGVRREARGRRQQWRARYAPGKSKDEAAADASQRLHEAAVARAGAAGQHLEGHLRPRPLWLHAAGHA